MSEDDAQSPMSDALVPLAARSLIGGTLMGLANLVPGVSGGTMLLAAGVYTRFVDAVAEVTTFRFRVRSLVTLACVVGAAMSAIVLLAGVVAGLVVEHRWVMYSVFIGLTLGGAPIIWKRAAGHHGRAFWVSSGVAFALMGGLALIKPGGGGETGIAMMFVGGLVGASAMILPGVSGGYLLLLLGLYVPILSAVDAGKDAAKAGEWDALLDPALGVYVPVGVGVLVGVVGVSNLVRILMKRAPAPTFGSLLGLVAGAVLGLWPFQAGRPPELGEVVKGQAMTAELLAELDPDDYPTSFFTPTPIQIGASIALVAAGFGATRLIDRFGEQNPRGNPDE